MVGIQKWGCYLPRYRIRAEEIAMAWGKDAEQMKAGLRILQKTVPGIDEDAVTMAVEAARNARTEHIGAVYIGSESHPYAVKPTGTIVAAALDLSDEYTTADFEFACKAGTAAMQVALGLVKSGMKEAVLIGGSDTAQAAPGDVLEYTAGAGAAMFVIGKDPAARINETVSFTTDTPDFWRRSKQKYPAHAGTFTGEPAYFRHVINATRRLMGICNTNPEDYDYAVFHQPNGKFPVRAARRLGFTQKQIEPGLLVPQIGNTYSAAALLGLCAVLDIAKQGDRILVTSYGSGAGSDSFDITVTERIAEVQTPTVRSYMENVQHIDYATYMRYTGKIQ